jgi:tetratricopeptide (TPR) repeat protein
VFEDNNSGYMVMNFEQGESLGEKLKGRKTLEEADLIKYLIPILGGLEHMHRNGFIHRDVKPDNIFIRHDGSPVLLDFGSARQALGSQTRTLTSLVTPGFAPYEQYYSKSNEQGPWTDIYGLGATLYRAVTGVAPMDAVDRGNALLKRKHDTYISCKEFGKGKYSDRLLQAIDHSLQFNIDDRPKTIAEWRAEFDLPVAPLPSARTEYIPTQPGTTVRRPLPVSTPVQDGAKARSHVSYRSGRMIAAILLVTLAAGAGWLFRDNLQSLLGQWRQGRELEALLEDAKADLAAQRYNAPAGDNALENFREMLNLDPANAEARLGLQTINDYLVRQAHQAIAAGDFSGAEKFLADAGEIQPDAANIWLAREELARKQKEKQQAEAEAQANDEMLQAVLRQAGAVAEQGDVQSTLARLVQAGTLGADEAALSAVKNRLLATLKAQIDAAAAEARTAVQDKNPQRARAALQRAKKLKSQLDTL